MVAAPFLLHPSTVGGSITQNGLSDSVRGVALNTVLNVLDRKLSLQEKMQLTIRQAHGHVQHPEREDENN